MLLLSCRTVTIEREVKVVPNYVFPEVPEFPEVEKLPDGRYAIDGNYFKSLEAFFTLYDALELEYSMDKKVYNERGEKLYYHNGQ